MQDLSHSSTTDRLTPAQKRELLAQILKERANRSEEIHPLSFNQRSMWFLQQLAPESSAYNLAATFRIVSTVDPDALRRALQKLVNRHGALRTHYISRSGEPFQVVKSHRPVNFQVIDATLWPQDRLSTEMETALRTPFDLEHDDVMRVKLYRRSSLDHVFQIVIHHIATDGWSLWIMLSEINHLYAAELSGVSAPLPPLEYKYADFVKWQETLLGESAGESLRSFWIDQLSNASPLELPTDYVRPAVQKFVGATENFDISIDLVQQLRELARQHQTTLFTLLAATFQLLLHRYSNQEDILLATPVLGRNRDEFNYVVGDFVNSVVLRGDLSGNPIFFRFLAGHSASS